ncbi:hypothetical protein EZV62_017551 [Acer yangbiense]|uniref:Uncharacterized protein n=1 Tax=Acer yangbiense TaxID=1000413 RepID=A0A5C7HHG9_9ROSI|nr:hypothetical protein EZV62_017551 [Acer yangbiense]
MRADHEKQEGIEPRKLLITGNAEEMCSVFGANQAQRQGNQKEERIWRSSCICVLESLDLVIKGYICEHSSCRQVSRSPNCSKNSQRRHPPYSSLETYQGKDVKIQVNVRLI